MRGLGVCACVFRSSGGAVVDVVEERTLPSICKNLWLYNIQQKIKVLQ